MEVVTQTLKEPKIELSNEDCMDLMARYPDNYFDLAIVDPPYGINAGRRRGDTGRNKHIKQKDYHYAEWDKEIPKKEYWDELFRVSKNQIVWGGNYFIEFLSNTSCFIVWDKKNGENLYADCEIAWTSFDTAVRKFDWRWHGFLQQGEKQERIHPTEKPIKLYEWILINYAKEGNKILDTHLGSGSIAIACYNYKFDLTACEIDKEYFDKALERFNNYKSQLKLF